MIEIINYEGNSYADSMKSVIKISCLKAILIPSVILLLQFLACSKDDPIKPVPGQLPAPQFQLTDSVIMLEENQITCSISISANDTLAYFYTLDGTDPGRNSNPYDSATGIVLSEGQYTIKIIACSQSESSTITVRNFIISHIAPAIVSGIETKSNYHNPVTIQISNYSDALSYLSELNSAVIDLSSPVLISDPGFYTLVITSSFNAFERSDTFLFVIMDPSRNETDWGLKTWVPLPFIVSELKSEVIESVYPKSYVSGINLPVILKTTDAGIIKPLYLQVSNSINSNLFNIKRGIGSVNLLTDSPVEEITMTCGNRNTILPVTFENADWTVLKGTLSGYKTGINARIHIDANLTIPSGDTFLIEEGTIIAVDEATDINNFGMIEIKGTNENPVVITCYNPTAYWGGFISKGTGNAMHIEHSILCQSGYHTSAEYQWGHAQRQALFYLENTDFHIQDSYLLDHIGQVFYSRNASLDIERILVQRAKTGGQLNTSQVKVNESIFSDFPNDTYVYQDNDNDALYISHCDAAVSNSVFMFAKDDGIDSGEDEGGTVNIDHCRFESTFHEGIALSSKNPAVRKHNITNCIVTNCGQGIELGFSSPFHTVVVDNCLLYKNGIGLRYGDNYDWNLVEGTMIIKNTRSVNNLNRDVWNMVHRLWSPNLAQMQFTGTYISKPTEQYPDLPILTGFDDYPE